MLVFSDVAESKGFESIVPKVDGSVETNDVVACLEGPILKVDVATFIISDINIDLIGIRHIFSMKKKIMHI